MMHAGAAMTLQKYHRSGGQLKADNGRILAQGAVSGQAAAIADTGRRIEFGSKHQFARGIRQRRAAARIRPRIYRRYIAGFATGDFVQFSDIQAAGATVGYTANRPDTSGTLKITDAIHDVFNLNIVGSGYTTANFSPTQDVNHHLVIQFA